MAIIARWRIPSGELVGVAVDAAPGLGDPYEVEQFGRAVAGG